MIIFNFIIVFEFIILIKYHFIIIKNFIVIYLINYIISNQKCLLLFFILILYQKSLILDHSMRTLILFNLYIGLHILNL